MTKQDQEEESFLHACFSTMFPWKYQNHAEYWAKAKAGRKYNGDLQVIGAGYGRTGILLPLVPSIFMNISHLLGFFFSSSGTASMQAAMEILYDSACYHGYDNILRDDFAFWTAASLGKPVNFREVLQGFCATVDWPACRCWREIADTYPNAKIILTVRDPISWYRSVIQTVFTHLYGSPSMSWGSWVTFMFHPYWRRFGWMHYHNCNFLHRDFSQANIIKKFNSWNDSVIQSCPSERLLVFDVKEGWEPLCNFLNKPIPNVPFPHCNDTKKYTETVVKACDYVGYFMFTTAVGSVSLVTWLWLKRKN